MTFLDKFLNIDLTAPREVLLDLFVKSIYEIRSEEVGVSLDSIEKTGDLEAKHLIKTSSVQEVCLHTDNVKLVDNVPEHAQKILDNYNKNKSVTVFRGTRLPLPNSSFNNGFIHTTPHFATSTAYAVGISNGYGGIGRLLTQEKENLGLGFVHAYEAPLTTKTYKNFQFERFLNGSNPDSEVTLENFKQELESFAKKDKSDFTVEYFSEKSLYGKPGTKIPMSESMQKWYDFISSTKCMETQYYEVMLPQESIPKFTFLIDKNLKLVKLDLKNPKTQKVLDKLQNLLMKDFYEIVPLDKLVKNLEDNISCIKEDQANKIDAQLLELVKNESLLLTELKQSVLDMINQVKTTSLSTAQDIEAYMQQSTMVGSTNMIGEPTNDSKVKYHKIIEDFVAEIYLKKQQIEMPLEKLSQSKSLFIQNEPDIIKDNHSLNLLDKLLNNINEKNINHSLILKKIDNDSVMLECMLTIEKNLKLKHIDNPTVGDFVNALENLKKYDLFRQHVGKKLLSDNYQPFMQFIIGKTLKQYVNSDVCDNVKLPIDVEFKDKSITAVTKNIQSIRSVLKNNKNTGNEYKPGK